MELDSYWRTRTIAEAQDQGYGHLRVTCSSCGPDRCGAMDCETPNGTG
jgi:hypothetical protein